MLRSAYDITMNKILAIYSSRLNQKYNYSYSPSTKERFSEIPSFINSWQAVCMESEVKLGKIISKNIMGENIIIWKNSDNEISILNAHCPHFGIHLASGGEILNGKIVCPFHHRKFDVNGHCAGKKKNAFSYPVTVNAGIVFVWFSSEKEPPSWDLPSLEKDLDNEYWEVKHTRLVGIKVDAHPMTYIENGVDFGHAIALHGLRQEETNMEVDNETLSVFFKHSNNQKGYFNIKAYGPFVVDYKVTFTWWKKANYRFLVLLQLTPDNGFIAHKIKMKKRENHNSLFIKLLHAGAFVYFEFKLLKTFMKEDHMIMINRKHLEEPDYSSQDLYTKDFRVWYKQFYPKNRNINSQAIDK